MDVKTHAQQIFEGLINGWMAGHSQQPQEAELKGFAVLAWRAANIFAATPPIG